ncbi:hypothetical protein llap_10416 [Limosa lapponica baueri]|uniref:Uncharacterized protein n=1 Tax=Limosa lapponica baueri TaxID=1758121 RepID=A0A2I0TZT9_LIMLA|nr:hypothetical protein llap_10416 [Limosa lapponica baueri]
MRDAWRQLVTLALAVLVDGTCLGTQTTVSSPGDSWREPAVGTALESQAFTAFLFGPAFRREPGPGSAVVADLCCTLPCAEPLGTMWQGSHFPKTRLRPV